MFQDVDQQSTLGKAVDYVARMDLISGYADGTFRPNEKISLAEVFGTLYDVFPEDDTLFSYMNDDQDHWGEGYAIYYQKEYGVSKEWTGEEKLDQPISFQNLHDILTAISEKRKLCSCPLFVASKKMLTRGEFAQRLYYWLKPIGAKVTEKLKNSVPQKSYREAFDTLREYQFFRDNIPTDFQDAYELLWDEKREETEEQKRQYFTCMMDIMACKDDIFRPLPGNTELAHYTSLRALESLTRPGARFRLSPVAYLNDPQEGRIGLKNAEAKFEKYGEPFSSWSKRVPVGVFVGSFFRSKDSDNLPMWIHYGNGAEGCVIKMKASDLGEDVYEVKYTHKKKFDAFTKAVVKVLDGYHEKIGKPKDVSRDPVFMFAKSVVEQVSFLVKDEHYAYEKEVRVLQFKDPRHAKKEESGGLFPRIYSELEAPVRIRGVVLGSKVREPEKIILALAHRGLDANHMEQSEIEYR